MDIILTVLIVNKTNQPMRCFGMVSLFAKNVCSSIWMQLVEANQSSLLSSCRVSNGMTTNWNASLSLATNKSMNINKNTTFKTNQYKKSILILSWSGISADIGWRSMGDPINLSRRSHLRIWMNILEELKKASKMKWNKCKINGKKTLNRLLECFKNQVSKLIRISLKL